MPEYYKIQNIFKKQDGSGAYAIVLHGPDKEHITVYLAKHEIDKLDQFIKAAKAEKAAKAKKAAKAED